MSYEKKVHLLWPRDGAPAKTIACGKTVGVGQRWTQDPAKASCYDCARNADGLTPEQRDEIWENENERLGKFKRSPWRDQVAARKEQGAA